MNKLAVNKHKEYEATIYKNKVIVKPRTEPDKHSKYHLTIDELKSLEKNAPSNRDRVIISLMGRCGLRRAEVINLEIEHIDSDRALLNLVVTKGMKARTVPISEQIARDLVWLSGKRKHGFLFVGRDHAKLSLRQVNRVLARAADKANIVNPDPLYKNVNPHLLRHSFVYWWKKKNARIDILSRILGHSNIKTTEEMYGTPGIEDYREEYNRVWSEE